MPRKEYMSDPTKCQWYLDRLQFFLNILGNPEKQIPHYIHVTGTSGKGSTVSFLHSILQANNKKVGSTYSPHPSIITERWKIGNNYMSKREFVELIEHIKPKLDEYTRTTPYDMLSFFELTEAIGFVYFARKKVDWLVMEVACGGRYDSSNVIPHKDVAVITNIGLDHVGIIGKNKEEIAYEKAGIIKQGCKVFTGEKDKKILEVIKKECTKKKTKLKIFNLKFSGNNDASKEKIFKQCLNESIFNYDKHKYIIKVPGNHQIKNAVLCIEIAKSLGTPQNKIKQGLKNAHQPLRMEIVSYNPTVILDSAHNPDKIKSTVKTIKLLNSSTNKPVRLVIGFSANKDIKSMLKALTTLNPKSIAITRNTTNIFRKVADPQKIQKQLKKLLQKTKTQIFLDPQDAFVYTKKTASKNDLILVTGSIFLSGELKE